MLLKHNWPFVVMGERRKKEQTYINFSSSEVYLPYMSMDQPEASIPVDLLGQPAIT